MIVSFRKYGTGRSDYVRPNLKRFLLVFKSGEYSKVQQKRAVVNK